MNVRKQERREQAEIRNAQWASKTYEQQLAHLDSLFGEGQGAAKQRAKIARQITARDNASKKKKK